MAELLKELINGVDKIGLTAVLCIVLMAILYIQSVSFGKKTDKFTEVITDALKEVTDTIRDCQIENAGLMRDMQIQNSTILSGAVCYRAGNKKGGDILMQQAITVGERAAEDEQAKIQERRDNE